MTLPLDHLTLILGGILLLLAVITPLFSTFLRKPKIVELEGTPDTVPGFSIVMVAHDNAAELDANLRKYLSQKYNDFQVIVVVESADHETEDVLERYLNEYASPNANLGKSATSGESVGLPHSKQKPPRLLTTFVPSTSHYVSRHKLALTLGVKAACYEWIVMTEPYCQPADDCWLEALSRYTDDADMLCCYTSLRGEAFSGFDTFLHLQTFCRNQSSPWRYDGKCLAFRKELFMSANGFLRNLKFLRGEYDFLTNEFGGDNRVMITNEPATITFITSSGLSDHRADQLYYMETRRHLERTLRPRLSFLADQTTLHLNFLFDILIAAYALSESNWVLCGAALMSLVLSTSIRTALVCRSANALGEHLSFFKAPLYELASIWHILMLRARYALSNKADYIRR